MRRLAVLTCLVACGGGGNGTPAGDAGADAPLAADASLDAPADAPPAFTPVAPPSNPLPVQNLGGTTIASPQLVLLTFGGDPNAAAMDTFMAWLPTSSYFTSSLAEYGITAGTYAGAYTFAATAPASYTLAQFGAALDTKIANRDFGTPTASTAYVVLVPYGVAIPDEYNGVTCQDFTGFHYRTPAGYPYGLVFTCSASTSLAQLTDIASHEVAETVTDVYNPGLNGWVLPRMSVLGGEVGDLCESMEIVADGHTVERLFSNTAAAAGVSPCVPADPQLGYAGVAPVGASTLTLTPGTSATMTWQAFATQRPIGPLQFYVAYDANLSISTSASCTNNICTVNPGDTFTIGVTANATAYYGYYELLVTSLEGSAISARWAVRVEVPPTTCDALAQNCGTGEACDRSFDEIANTVVASCEPAGPGAPLSACVLDRDCVAGSACVAGTCYAICGVCDQNTSCSSSYSQTATYCAPNGTTPTFCNQIALDGGGTPNYVGVEIVCTPGCDPLNPPCSDTYGNPGDCYAFGGGEMCTVAGTLATGAACTYLNDCVPGDACLGDHLCHQLCAVGGANTCPGGTTCSDLHDPQLPGLGGCY